MALAANVQLDVWSVSRIAHFLHTDPAGQIIRRSHLGAQVALLSCELLLEMGKRSIRDHFQHLPLQDAAHRKDFVLLNDEDHLSVAPRGFTQGLKYLPPVR